MDEHISKHKGIKEENEVGKEENYQNNIIKDKKVDDDRIVSKDSAHIFSLNALENVLNLCRLVSFWYGLLSQGNV